MAVNAILKKNRRLTI